MVMTVMLFTMHLTLDLCSKICGTDSAPVRCFILRNHYTLFHSVCTPFHIVSTLFHMFAHCLNSAPVTPHWWSSALHNFVEPFHNLWLYATLRHWWNSVPQLVENFHFVSVFWRKLMPQQWILYVLMSVHMQLKFVSSILKNFQTHFRFDRFINLTSQKERCECISTILRILHAPF